MINEKMLSDITEQMKDVPLCELPDDTEFAKEIVKVLSHEKAMEAIEAYTRYATWRITNTE